MHKFIQCIVDWKWPLITARKTVNKKPTYKQPSKKFKLQMLYAEHSPIRTLIYYIDYNNIKRWVSGHICRHSQGVSHFIGTQRTDRTGIPRDKLPQDEPTGHSMFVNAAEIIFISRKRLCKIASKETQDTWKYAIDEIKKIDPELASVCVPECIYRGFCPEGSSCGYSKTVNWKLVREKYVDNCINVRN